MPYKKRYYKKKAPTRPGYSSCGAMVAGDAARMAAFLKPFLGLNTEYKFHDNPTITVGNQTNVPTVTQITDILQGDSGTERDGNQCRVVSLTDRLEVTINPAASNSLVRRIYFVWNDDDVPTAPDILASPTDVNSLLALGGPAAAGKKYRVIHDKVYRLSLTGIQTVQTKVYKTFKALKPKWTGPNPTDIAWNHLFCLQISNEPINGPSLSGHARVRFVDN